MGLARVAVNFAGCARRGRHPSRASFRARRGWGVGWGAAWGPSVGVFASACIVALVGLRWGESPACAASHTPDAGAPITAEAGAAQATARPARETFVVTPFVNGKRVRALDYLETGLPAFVAERLAQHAPLRFVGAPTLLSPKGAALPGARFVV